MLTREALWSAVAPTPLYAQHRSGKMAEERGAFLGRASGSDKGHNQLMRRQTVQNLIANCGAELVAVAYQDLETDDGILINPDESFHAASTMKLGVLIELFNQARTGERSLNEKILIHNEFKSIADGSSFCVPREDDSEQSLYERLGDRESLINLARPMITHSSNLATNLLVDRLGASRITATMSELGAAGLVVRRGVEDGKAYRLGMNNTATACSLSTLFLKLAKGEVVSSEASRAMVEILLAQTHRDCLPARLPPEAKVANKPGWNDGICHDAGIVHPPIGQPYVLAVLTSGASSHETAVNLIASISRVVYDQGFG